METVNIVPLALRSLLFMKMRGERGGCGLGILICREGFLVYLFSYSLEGET